MPATLEVDSVFAKDYRVLRPLDEGGMGVVYVVEQISTGESRALKVMQPHLVSDAKTRERFLQEAKVRARIKSEHVVKVIAAGVDEATGSPYIAMELLDGETLDAMVTRRERLTPGEVCTVFEHLGHALSAAHNAGVVHRDIKPENIFVASSQRADVPFTVKLLDFGIAKVVRQESAARTTTGALLGSPLWMAPEQCNAAKITPATDVWALGLLAFWCLTGEYYWKNAHNARVTIEALLVDILLSPIELPSLRAMAYGQGDAFPAALDEWFTQCIARDPETRISDAGEAVKALVLVLSNGRTRVTFPSLVSSAPGSTPDHIRPLAGSSPSQPTPDPRSDELATRPLFPHDTNGSAVAVSPSNPQPSAIATSSHFTVGQYSRVVIPAVVTSLLVAIAAFTVLGPGRPAPLATPPPAVVVHSDVPAVSAVTVDASPRSPDLPVVAAQPDAGRSRPVVLAPRPPAVPHSVGHTFRRQLSFDSQCTSNPRFRRAWAASPYFASHSESESAARLSNCSSMVGGIGWCCP